MYGGEVLYYDIVIFITMHGLISSFPPLGTKLTGSFTKVTVLIEPLQTLQLTALFYFPDSFHFLARSVCTADEGAPPLLHKRAAAPYYGLYMVHTTYLR